MLFLNPAVAMVFFGKYTFQSTNSSGPRRYLTSATRRSLTFPCMAASSVTEVEKIIAYQISTDGLILQLGNLVYLSAMTNLGWIVADAARANACVFRSTGTASATVLEIQVEDGWETVRYSVNVIEPYLAFSVAAPGVATADDDSYTTLQKLVVTPGLAAIDQSKVATGLDFRNVDLSEADFSGVDCSQADFTGSTLDGVDFSGANLSRATFVGASMDQTNLAGATVERADFTGADLSTVKWGKGIRASGAIFVDAVVIEATIGSSDSQVHADLSGANLEGADFSRSDLSQAKLGQANLVRSVFVGANLSQCDFTSAQLGGLDKSAAADLSFAYLANVVFDKANLFGVSFAFSTLFGASSRLTNAATLEQADFSNAYLAGIDLAGAPLQGAKFNNSCLVNVDFSNADLSPTLSGSVTTSLAGASLHGAVFAGAKLQNADLANATVSPDPGTIDIRYCDFSTGGPFPPAPDFEPLRHPATSGLDLTTMTSSTICPNGLTVAANQTRGSTLAQMLTTANPATEWIPLQCAFKSVPNPVRESNDSSKRFSTSARLPTAPTVMESDELCLQEFSLRHFRDFCGLLQDPAVAVSGFLCGPTDEQRIKAAIHHFKIRQRRSGIAAWPAYHKPTGTFVGVCGLADCAAEPGLEINIAVAAGHRGSSLSAKMHRLVQAYAFTRLACPRLLGLVTTQNHRAKKFTCKLGFRFLFQTTVDGITPMDLYELTAEEFHRHGDPGIA